MHQRLRSLASIPAATARIQRRPFSSGTNSLPDQSRIVVVGGGIIGNSIAYHLARLNQEVVVLEQSELTAGTTWHAAGLMVTFGSLSETSTEIRKYSKDLYSKLELETGQSTGFNPVGFIELATNRDRLEEYRRVASFNRKCGVDVQEISPSEVLDKFPLCRTEDVLAGFYVPDDGRVNPVDATMSLSKGAKMHGAKYFSNIEVDKVLETFTKNGQREVCGVVTACGHTIKCEKVVNCAGMWARQFGEKNGVCIPNQAAEHYYLVTEAMKEVDPQWPVIEDPSSYTYIRPEGGGLMIGLFEPEAAAWNCKSVPSDFSFGEITPDIERMAPFVEKAMNRVPQSQNVGLKTFFCGPESFSPDLSPICGEAPEINNYFVAAGMNSIGILSGGGLGRIMAQWIVDGKPDVDVTGMNIDRFHRYQCNIDYRRDRVVESLANVYKPHYPYKPMLTARGAKHTPFYESLKLQGAQFNDISGWEVPDWFGVESGRSASDICAERKDSSDFSLAKSDSEAVYEWRAPYFFQNWKREHAACRENVVLIDMSFMAKFMVEGRDAGEALNRLCTSDIDGPSNTITYTQFLNEDGCLEADVTVCKLQKNKFLVIATDTMHRHVEAWLRRNLDPEGSKHVLSSDVTGGFAQLNIQGPNSRKVLEKLTDVDMSNESFPFRMAQHIPIGFTRVLCARITYVGELGYELHIPTEHALSVYNKVTEVGKEFGLQHAGLKALSSLRLEKGYRDYGHDMDNLDTLLEVGLGFTADYDKPGGFLGKEKVLSQRKALKEAKGLPRRLVQVLIPDHPEVMLYHGEVLWRDGVRVGDIRAASYGHTLGGAVGLGMVDGPDGALVNKAFLQDGNWEVEVGAERYPVRVSLAPLYDPKNLKIKA